MKAMQLEREVNRVALADRRNFIHKRMERWVRLQQFVFGLPDDFTYAACIKESPGGHFTCHSVVKVGWMTWFGLGASPDRQHCVNVALLNASEAVSANSTAVFFHKLRSFFSFSHWEKKASRKILPSVTEAEEGRLLAG